MYKQLGDFGFEWALTNVKEDVKDDGKEFSDIFKSIFETLKPWLNHELWLAERKYKAQGIGISTTFIDELRQRGATEEELKPMMEEQEQLIRQSESLGLNAEDEDDDQMTVIK